MAPLILRQLPLLELTKAHLDMPELANAAQQLRQAADHALSVAPISITEKRQTPPSGDKRDYMSQGPYWHPNPDTADGLPYVRRDGELNPEFNDFDRPRLYALIQAVDTLALGWYFLGDVRYAEHAGELLRVFFLDEERGMRPHLSFGQAIPGICDGRGIGIIETVIVAEKLIDALRLLEDSPGLSEQDIAGLRQWCANYLDWLLTSPHGLDEAAEHNNHGSGYDLQVCALAIYLGRNDLASEVLQTSAMARIRAHIEPDGRQPHELARTRALCYSTFNLQMLFGLAHLGDLLGLDLWAPTEDGRSLRNALDWLIPFWTNEAAFSYEQIIPFQPEAACDILRRAAVKWNHPYYARIAEKIAPGDYADWRSRLLYPTID